MSAANSASLLFIATTFLSVQYLMKSRKNPENDRPWLGKEYGLTPSDPEAGGNKDPVWSTDTHDIAGGGGEDDQHNHRAPSDGTDRGGDQEEDEYHLLHGGADAESRTTARPAGGTSVPTQITSATTRAMRRRRRSTTPSTAARTGTMRRTTTGTRTRPSRWRSSRCRSLLRRMATGDESIHLGNLVSYFFSF